MDVHALCWRGIKNESQYFISESHEMQAYRIEGISPTYPFPELRFPILPSYRMTGGLASLFHLTLEHNHSTAS